jgi:hypothetical protein
MVMATENLITYFEECQLTADAITPPRRFYGLLLID